MWSVFDIFKKNNKPELSVKYTPVLRNFDSFKDMVVHQIISDDLGLFAARLNTYPDGSVFIDYVMKNQLAEFALTEEAMMQQCIDEFNPGQVNGLENEQGENFYYLSGTACCSSVIGLPKSYEKFKE